MHARTHVCSAACCMSLFSVLAQGDRASPVKLVSVGHYKPHLPISHAKRTQSMKNRQAAKFEGLSQWRVIEARYRAVSMFAVSTFRDWWRQIVGSRDRPVGFPHCPAIPQITLSSVREGDCCQAVCSWTVLTLSDVRCSYKIVLWCIKLKCPAFYVV